MRTVIVALLMVSSLFAGSTITNGNNINIRGMSNDGSTLFAYTYGVLYRSTNGGASWGSLHSFGVVLDQIFQLANGELIVTTQGTGCQIWLSSGYPSLGASASWTNVLNCQGGNSAHISYWGHSTYANIVVLAEYGLKLPTDKGRYAFLSQDSGQTWTTIYDVGTDDGSHLHGIAYDHWSGCILLANGDHPYTDNHFSCDLGQTWVELTSSEQITSILAMPAGVLWATDGEPNGVLFSTRGDGSYSLPALAYQLSAGTNVQYVAAQPFLTPSGVALFTFEGNYTNPGVLLATSDGVSFSVMWQDFISYASTPGGLLTMVGPLSNGAYVGDLHDGRYTYDSILTITPGAVAGGASAMGGKAARQ